MRSCSSSAASLRATALVTVSVVGMMLAGAALAGCGGGTEVSTSGTSSGTTGGGGAGGNGSGSGATGGAGVGGSTTMSTGGSGGGTTTTPMSCSGKSGVLGDSNQKLTIGGVERNADVHVPASYDPTKPVSLVFDFHGNSSTSFQEALLSNMSAASDERGFIVVYPNGLSTSWNAGNCCGLSQLQGVDDVGYVAALIEKLEADYCIDAKRVFAAGMSNGGFLAHRLACEMSDKIAAIAPVAGVIGIPLEECLPGRAVPVMHFHGTGDTVVPYYGGGLSGFVSVADSIARWRAIDECDQSETVTFEKGDSKCVTSACALGSEVTLCTVTLGGHTWPGGTPVPALGITSIDLDATNHMLDFFEAHPLP